MLFFSKNESLKVTLKNSVLKKKNTPTAESIKFHLCAVEHSAGQNGFRSAAA